MESTRITKRARRSLRKVVARWQRLRLSVPFDDWVGWAEEVKSNRLKISRCVRRLRKATVIAAWARWIEFTGESRRQRVLAARASRCLARLANRIAARAFARWRDSVGRDLRHRAALRKIAIRWQRLQLSAPFNDWADWADEVRANRLKLSRFLHRMRTVKTAAAFARWDENRVEMKRQRHVMRRAEGYFRRANAQVLSKAFNAWAENASGAKRHRYLLEKIISRWQRLQLAAPFNDWADWVHEVQANRVKLSRFLHRMRTALIASAFVTWCGPSSGASGT